MIAQVRFDEAEEALVMREAAVIAAERILSESLLNIDEASGFLKVSSATLNRLPIPRVKLGGATRYRRQDLLQHIQASLEK